MNPAKFSEFSVVLLLDDTDNEPKPKFTAEVTTEIITPADPVNEAAAGAYSQS